MIQNPVLKGFCPDPSIVRVGEDYYIATSTFEWWPGVKLFHSRDLKHYEQLPSPLNRTKQLNLMGAPASGGVWAPDISYDGMCYYLVFTDVKTKKGRYYNNHNYVVKTSDPQETWSDPIYLNSTGFDPSLFHDRDGRSYLVNMRNGFKGILVQEYDTLAQKLKGEAKNVYTGTGVGCTEGPHIYHIGEWYYLLMAEGGTGYEHCVTMARARSVWGPYEADPHNPVLTSENSENALQKCGHGDLTDTGHGEWYLVHLCARPLPGGRRCVLGRETAVQKMTWNEDGWLRLEAGGRFGKWEAGDLAGVEECACPAHASEETAGWRDDFDKEELPVRYVSPRIPLWDAATLRERPGYLRLYGQESANSAFRVSLVAARQRSFHVRVETYLEFDPQKPEQAAGLAYLYDNSNFFLFLSTANEEGQRILTLIKSDQNTVSDEMKPVLQGEKPGIHMRIETSEDGMEAVYSWSQDGANFIEAARTGTDMLTDEHCRGFTGAHFGMYCHDMTGSRLFADFDYFEYHDL